jgi:hypothetical protein
LHLERADIEATVHDAIKSGAALIEERRRSKIRIPCVNRRAAGQQRMGECRSAVVLQLAKYWIDIDLVAGSREKAARKVITNIVTVGRNRATLDFDISAGGSSFQDCVPDRK